MRLCFSIIYVHHKCNGVSLLLSVVECTSCLTTCVTSWRMEELGPVEMREFQELQNCKTEGRHSLLQK